MSEGQGSMWIYRDIRLIIPVRTPVSGLIKCAATNSSASSGSFGREQKEKIAKINLSYHMRRKNSRVKMQKRVKDTSNIVEFSFSELHQYGNQFQDSTILGQGSFGVVHKGLIPENNERRLDMQEIAIKVNRGPTKRVIEFEMERSILASISHPNIIKLVGYSNDNNSLCLVYEYMTRGSLKRNIPGLDWPKTLQIIRDMASVVHHLHQQSPQIIFRDLKSENILIDENFNAKLSDFGLAKRGNEGVKFGGTEGSSDVIAIYGPAIPESDVYSIGILILELLTKKQFVHKGKLPNWVRGQSFVKGKIKNIKKVVHETLRASGCNCRNGRKAIKLGLQCAHDKTFERPTIEDVCRELSNLKVVGTTRACLFRYLLK